MKTEQSVSQRNYSEAEEPRQETTITCAKCGVETPAFVRDEQGRRVCLLCANE